METTAMRPQKGEKRSALALGLVPLMAALILGLSACRTETVKAEFDSTEIINAGNLAIQHGKTMVELGNTMIERGKRLNNKEWQSHGQHWVDDGKSAQLLGEQTVRLGQSFKGNPFVAEKVHLDLMQFQGQSLLDNGKALQDHGRGMVQITTAMREIAQPIGDRGMQEDVAASTELSGKMQEIGSKLVTAGQSLLDFTDRMRRSIAK